MEVEVKIVREGEDAHLDMVSADLEPLYDAVDEGQLLGEVYFMHTARRVQKEDNICYLVTTH